MSKLSKYGKRQKEWFRRELEDALEPIEVDSVVSIDEETSDFDLNTLEYHVDYYYGAEYEDSYSDDYYDVHFDVYEYDYEYDYRYDDYDDSYWSPGTHLKDGDGQIYLVLEDRRLANLRTGQIVNYISNPETVWS